MLLDNNIDQRKNKIVEFLVKFIIEIVRVVIICLVVACIFGCQSMNSRFSFDRTDYSEAKELPPLKLPAGALAVSKRYDIPDIPGNKDLIIDNNAPPDYY